jgi:hypothetical protein
MIACFCCEDRLGQSAQPCDCAVDYCVLSPLRESLRLLAKGQVQIHREPADVSVVGDRG